MKFRVYKEKNKAVYFKLIRDPEGDIILTAVDAAGRHLDNILYISDDGIHLTENVSPDIGLPLDDKGKVLIVG